MLLLLGLFLLTACSDPGIVYSLPLDEEEALAPGTSGTTMLMCQQCHIQRPSTACHCYECNVCVDKLDHHCPWTGKCIGKRNIRFFYGFLWMLSAHIAFVLGSCVYAWAMLVRVFDWRR
jgi:palmitoyltransferase ZDHHC9/14/18